MSLTQKGSTISGESRFGNSVDISRDGSKIIVGAPGAGTRAKGKALIYEYTSNSWSQVGGVLNANQQDNLGKGTGVAISRDGTTVAIGAINNDTFGRNVGIVRIYTLVSNTWTLKGNELPGSGEFNRNENYGISVSLNGDGTIVATASTKSKIRIHQYNSGTDTWDEMNQSSTDSLTPSGDSKFGISLALSNTGYRIAVGAYSDDNPGRDIGSVQVLEWSTSSSAWSRIGSILEGEDPVGDGRENFGACIDLSEDGTKLIVGSPGFDVTGSGNQGDGSKGSNDGKVYIYEYSSSSWNAFGNTLTRSDVGDRFGCGVAISNDGLKIAAAYQGANDKGFVNYYEYNNGTSQWDLEQTLSGASNGDFFGGNANDLNGVGSSLMMSKDGSTLIVGSDAGNYVQIWEGQSTPTLTSVTIASSYSDNTKAKLGNTITLTLTASESLSGNPTVAFTGANNSVTVTNTTGNTYTASYVVASNDTNGVLAFTIDFTSSGGVAGTQVTSITSGQNITIDTITPFLNSVSIASNNSDNTKAITGNTVTLTLTSSESLSANPTVVFTGANNADSVTNTTGNTYTASYVVAANDVNGVLRFTIDFSDSIGNNGVRVTSITTGQNVVISNPVKKAPAVIIRKQKIKQKIKQKNNAIIKILRTQQSQPQNIITIQPRLFKSFNQVTKQQIQFSQQKKQPLQSRQQIKPKPQSQFTSQRVQVKPQTQFTSQRVQVKPQTQFTSQRVQIKPQTQFTSQNNQILNGQQNQQLFLNNFI